MHTHFSFFLFRDFRFWIFFLYFCMLSHEGFPQSSNRNYIMSRTFTDASGVSYQDKIDYYDGLGRLEQSVLRNAAPNGGDIVTLQEYDNLGRESNQWLPMGISGNSGKHVSFDAIKSRAISFYGDSCPYSALVYESSPLNRILEQYGPGEEWHLHSHSIKTSYLTNVLGNDTLNCICYSVNDSSNDTIITVMRLKNYESSQLFVTRMEDEDGNTSFEFKNKLGQILLTRSILRKDNSKTILDTYYIYNDFGNLVVVLPPEASDVLRTSASSSWRSDTTETIARYAFLYKYNSRNLQSAKKLPGCSWTFYIYDKGDQLIFSQDGNQRARGEWSFSIPDALGKECLSGICTNSLNAFSEPFRSVVIKALWLPDATSPVGSGPHKGYYLSGVSLSSPMVLLVNYYNDYSFLGKNGIPAGTDDSVSYESSAESEGFGKCYTASAQGMLTGMLTANLDNSNSPSYSYTVMYYDSYGQPIQIKSSNHLAGGVEKEYFAYNFIGQPVKKRHIHSANGKPVQTEDYTFTYDQAGRSLTTTHQLNNGTPVTVISNSYDSVGRLIRNSRNGTSVLQSNYMYNVRSWTQSITAPLFRQHLYYNDRRSNGTNSPLYSGNISGMDWMVRSDKERGYNFSYDGLSRLTSASYLERNVPSDKFTTSYSYDKHGNILSLSRHGNVGTSIYGLVDDLTFCYKGNQLTSIEDAGRNPSLSMSMDFKNGARQEIEYAYDANGNQTKDLNKGISKIEYNILNLPQRINFSGVNNRVNEYVYSAGGKKLSVIHKSSIEKRTDYVGNMIYENGSLKRILFDGGYIEDGQYHFYLQDHLGNNRVVAKADGTIVQTNHYYPYGMSFAEGTFADKQPYKYNGKELDTENELNLYDYEARQLEVTLGHFTGVDPLAEKYYSSSPYVYCGNNPIRFIDPDGRDWYQSTEDENMYIWREGHKDIDGYTRLGSSMSFRIGDDSYLNFYQNAGIKANKLVSAFDLISSSGKLQNTLLGKNSILSDKSKEELFNALNSRAMDQIARPIGEMLAECGIGAVMGGVLGKTVGYIGGRIAGKGMGRVFWSGGDKAMNAAMNYARSNGMTTLEMTRAGKNLTNLTRGMPWAEAGPMWQRLSKMYANGAKGTVHVFQNSQGIGVKSVWGTIEYPILKQNGVNIIYHIVK